MTECPDDDSDPNCVEEEMTETFREDLEGNTIVSWETDDAGTTEIIKEPEWFDGEIVFREFADGSWEEERFEYLDDDGWDYNYERSSVDAEGNWSYEFIDSEGNEYREDYSATGEEILGDWCDEDLPPEETWCYYEWIDVDGNHHVRTTDPD